MNQHVDISTTRLPPRAGGVIALGNFDGVHRGHAVVIQAAVDKARSLGVPARVLTFEPHPRAVLRPDSAPFRLTPSPKKQELLKAMGVDEVVVQDFTLAFASIVAKDFAHSILATQLNAKHIVAGHDFVFGHKRGGTMKDLQEWLGADGIGVTEIMPIADATGTVMSASRVRTALQNGDLDSARHILGRDWTISGVVQQGAQRGRSIGFPTANISLGEYLRPRFGVYAVTYWDKMSETMHKGVANIGVRPTVDGITELQEVHLFDFAGNLYGRDCEVTLKHFLRPEQKFNDINALRDQIAVDVKDAQSVLATDKA